MKTRKAKRIMRPLTAAEERMIKEVRQEIARELPMLAQEDRKLKTAAEEPSLSGELRRAVHAGPWPIRTLASRADVAEDLLYSFLLGEGKLSSDDINRVAGVLGCGLRPAGRKRKAS
jgi:hypothetical protein